MLVGHRMANLAGDLIPVNRVWVGPGFFGYCIRVALLAPRSFWEIESSAYIRGICMHLLPSVAVHARHLCFCIMNISRILIICPGKLAVDPPAMATSAGRVHARSFLKKMSGQKATLCVIRAANMALSAACMTGTAMLFFGPANLLQYSFILFVGTDLNNLFKGGQRIVEAVFCCGHDVCVAFAAYLFSIRKGWVSQNFPMGSLPVRSFGIPPMTRLTCDFPMLGL